MLPLPLALSPLGGWLVAAAMLVVPYYRGELTRARLSSDPGFAFPRLAQSVGLSAGYVAPPAEDLLSAATVRSPSRTSRS